MPSVLIVDDLLSIHEMLDAVIQPTGYSTAFATDGEKALAKYKSQKFDLVLADVDMRPMDGITLLRQLRIHDPKVVVVIMTAYASTESAVQALKYGAFDYLQKPFRVDDLIATLKRALESRKGGASPVGAAGSSGVSAAFEVGDIDSSLVGMSTAHKKLLAQIKKLSGVRSPVLLQGEPGTGKATLAELLHGAAAAADAPLVRVDCARSKEPAFRANLFGENGAGGLSVNQAQGGSLVLENLDQLDVTMQQDLVSVLRSNASGLRLICTSCEDLERLTEEGRFNDELFYRVASLPVQIPPLRSRPEDIPFLVRFFTERTNNSNFDSKLIEFAPDAVAVFKAYPWPGNISDLAQVVVKVVAATDTRVITADALPLRIKDLKGWPKLADHLAVQEKHYIEQVLNASRGNKLQAARILDVDVSRIG